MVVACGILIFSILNRAASAPESPIELKRFVSEEGNFSILMADKPWHSETHDDTTKVCLDSSILRPNFSKRYFFNITYRDFKKDKEEKPLEQRLKSELDRVLAYRGGKLINIKNVKVKGFPGFEARFSVNPSGFKNMQFLARIFESHEKFYYVAYGEGRRFSFSKELNLNLAYKFLDSFEFFSPEKA